VSVSLSWLTRQELAAFHGQIDALARRTRYPIGDGSDHFTIDHGDDSGAFFESLGDEARFVVAHDGDRFLGMIAGARRTSVGGPAGPLETIYLGDFKVAPPARGTGVAARVLVAGAAGVGTRPEAAGWRFLYFAAMHGAGGDVSRSFRGRLHPGRLARPLGTLALFFVAPAVLRALPAGGPAPTALPGLDLGRQGARQRVVRTTGRKDFRLHSTGLPWRLAHVPEAPAAWGAPLGDWLRRAAAELEPDETACFAIDERLAAPIGWLAAQGVAVGARCAVYGVPHPFLSRAAYGSAAWVHLPTSEI